MACVKSGGYSVLDAVKLNISTLSTIRQREFGSGKKEVAIMIRIGFPILVE